MFFHLYIELNYLWNALKYETRLLSLCRFWLSLFLSFSKQKGYTVMHCVHFRVQNDHWLENCVWDRSSWLTNIWNNICRLVIFVCKLWFKCKNDLYIKSVNCRSPNIIVSQVMLKNWNENYSRILLKNRKLTNVVWLRKFEAMVWWIVRFSFDFWK